VGQVILVEEVNPVKYYLARWLKRTYF